MNILKQIFLIIIGNLLFNANYAQCPIGETEITIQFIEDGGWPNEVNWDYKIKGVLSGSGPYTIYNLITTCVPAGDLSIVGCDTAGDTWNDAIFQISITEDGSLNGCTTQNGCLIYKSTVENADAVSACNGYPSEQEVAVISIGTCSEIQVLPEGCTNPEATNYDICATIDDGSCKVPVINNNCADAILIDILDDCTEYIYEYYNPYGNIDTLVECQYRYHNDVFYKVVVPPSGQFRFISTTRGNEISLYDDCANSALFCDEGRNFTNLNPNDTLLLKITNYLDSGYSFQFCLKETEPSENSNCERPTLVSVQKNQDCIDANYIELSELNNNSLSITPICNENAVHDAFYQFIVPSSGSIKVNNRADIGLALYYNCIGEPLFCESDVAQNVVTDLTPGDTLLLQIYDREGSDYASICIEEIFPPTNNDCKYPIFIDLSEENEIIQSYKYNDLDINSICNENVRADAFFSFVVPNSGQVWYNNSFWGNPQIALYSNCDIEPLLCETLAVNENYLFRNLTAGDTLLLQIASENFWDEISFTLKDASPTENNNCSNAKFIDVATINNYFIGTDTLFLRYNTENIKPECYESNFDSFDAFYKFIVPPSGNISFSKNDEYAGISIFESCNQNSIFCEPQGYGNIEINNLTSGDTLILQVYAQYNWVDYIYFQLEEIAPSLSNACTNALPINVATSGECITNEVDLTLKYNSPNILSSCNENSKPDAFYEFVVPQSGSVKVENSQYVGLALYKSCDGLAIYCNQDFNNQIINDLMPGETLILQFFERYDSNRFSFCIEEVAPSINNNCVDATSIIVAESGNCEMYKESVANLSYNSANIEPNCESSISYDAFYKFVVPETGQVLFSSTAAVGIAVYQACNDRSLFCEDYSSDAIIRNLPSGEMVVLQIFKDSNQPDFTFCLEEIVPTLNNLCINAEPFVVNEPGNCEGNYIQVPNTSNNTDINPYCASYVKADAFYSFIVPASGHIAISTSNEVGISIYDDCLEQSFYCNNSFQNEVIYGLNPSDTLILQAFQTNNPSNFDLCIEDAPPSNNNLCENAKTLQVYEEGSCEGNFISAPIKNNSVSINSSCQYIAADIFYKIIVPESGQIRIQTDAYGIGLSVYTTCDTTAIFCASEISDQLVQGLPVNEEVLLQFFDYYEKPNDFNLCIDDALPTANNDCSNAISVDVAAANAIFETNYTLNFQNNSANIRPICQSINQDAFYKFIVPENGKVIVGVSNGLGIALYNTCDGESIFCQSYIDDFETISDLPAGEELILQIFNLNSYNEIQFSISETINNTTCKNASILCEPTIISTNAGSNQSISRNEFQCDFSNNNLNNAVWYSFTADNSGSPVTFEINKSNCSKSHNDLDAIILSNSCGDEYVVEDCINVSNWGNEDKLSIKNPVPNQLYYIVVGSEYYNDFCNFEINVIEGIEMDCCQLDYSLDTWCYYLNTNNYFVDVTVNDLGQNPSGYQVEGTNKQITEVGTTTIGPIPNGTKTITLQGLDKTDCLITETIDFNCKECAEDLIHSNTNLSRNFDFNAAKTIESAIQVMPSIAISYSAGDSIILKQGFTVEKGAEFSIDIGECE